MTLTYYELDHPDGRWQRSDGTRFDLCVAGIKRHEFTESQLHGGRYEYMRGYAWPVREPDDKLIIGKGTRPPGSCGCGPNPW